MKRGDLAVAVLPGDFGKPRPALIVRADAFAELATVTVLPLTTTLQPARLTRIDCAPTRKNGLRERSQIMVDKIMTITKGRIGGRIGHLDRDTLLAVNRALASYLAIG
jgi:mRNA interferase MazF